MTGVASGSTFSTTGSSMSLGSLDRITDIFSLTSCTARSMSFSSTNSTVIFDAPSVLDDVIVLIPLMVLTDSSILSVTSMSMISGLAPLSSVLMLTMGRSTLGKRSTPMLG
ncbi:MAG: hypothetical protein A4E61_01497 [Syntrophorhabdus sp. PtaB.Bin184]|nr:MAG: hypothetical protein A4E61_01497 [Syntrophorhabdus sp. PtaB.Bin184]